MLDKTTKTKIDNARDILVGKVPNPQSQVELITIAMIYKFMDDMDMQNIEMGGNRIFFTDNLEQYAWRKVLSPKLNNWERISLYSEALDKLQVAKQIPELFRKIFKGAFLPFRDGATLSLFLNEIDSFSYNNSENLGNAFEYLLSIMGSQGDAGQFRTPRHIIDFIVDVVNPNRTDTILDPACGTAGFLISAYKHIIEQAEKNKKPLTPAQHQKLMENIVGYDISPDMVKLASVNLFLHQFPQPKIYEYDTLSSEDRWNEKFDIILANPPFMTPKGGIQPHNKFGVKANRAEVLFVDYMMEHLNLKGKAGFVVPEGIIFQSATAYKALRKMMVEENYLYAVVSLPSGVFNPYSGVKTSILLFDRELAKQSEDILFVKIDNDGYDLGAQRRGIKENDLPRATELLKAYQESLKNGNTFDISKYTKCSLISKDEIRENGEYNLTASRYEKPTDYSQCQYEMVKLQKLEEENKIIFLRGQGISKADFDENGKFKCIHYGDLYTLYNSVIGTVVRRTNYDGNIKSVSGDVLVPATTTADAMGIAIARALNEDNVVLGGDINIIRTKNQYIFSSFLSYIINFGVKKILATYAKGANILHLSNKDIKQLEIPLPPLEIQEEIVKELDQYQAIIDGAQKVVDNWKPTFEINPEWEKVKLGDVCRVLCGYAFKSTDFVDIGVQLIKMGNVKRCCFDYNNNPSYLPTTFVNDYEKYILRKNDLLISMTGTNGKEDYGNVCQVNTDKIYLLNQRVGKFHINYDKILNQFLYYIATGDNFRKQIFSNSSGGVRQANISPSGVENIIIHLPPLEEQKAIVTKIEEEEKYVDACKKLIEINKQKISDKIKSIWNCGNE